MALINVQVGNAQEELLHWYAENARDNPRIFHASERCASGIIQAMQHFGLQPNISPRDTQTLLEDKNHENDYAMVANLVVEFYLLRERWERGEIEQSENVLKSLKAVVVKKILTVLLFGGLICFLFMLLTPTYIPSKQFC